MGHIEQVEQVEQVEDAPAPEKQPRGWARTPPKKKARRKPGEAVIHIPSDKDMASLRLEIWRPEIYGQPTKEAWATLWHLYGSVANNVQVAMGDVLSWILKLRVKEGRQRCPTVPEKIANRGKPLPDYLFRKEDFERGMQIDGETWLGTAMQMYYRLADARIGDRHISSNIAAAMSSRIEKSELAFSGEKFQRVLNGEETYSTFEKRFISWTNQGWTVAIERIKWIARHKDENGKLVEKEKEADCPVFIVPIYGKEKGDGNGKGKNPCLRIICKPVTGRGATSRQVILNKMVQMSATIEKIISFKVNSKGKRVKSIRHMPQTSSPDGWKRGAIMVRAAPEPGQTKAQTAWYVNVAYAAPKPTAMDGTAVVMVHRGIANFLTVIVADAKGFKGYTYPGDQIVEHKVQFDKRRRRLYKNFDTLPRGKRSMKWRTARSLRDKEANATKLAIRRVARWFQSIVEQARAPLVIMEDFGTVRDANKKKDRSTKNVAFVSEIPTGDDSRYLAPYIRTFPFSAAKSALIDAAVRRAGTTVAETQTAYISLTCPVCGCCSEDNVARRPRLHVHEKIRWNGPGAGSPKHRPTRRTYVDDGSFKCKDCGLIGTNDEIAAINAGLRCKSLSQEIRERLLSGLRLRTAVINREKLTEVDEVEEEAEDDQE